jgi:hypothetical protein
MSPLPPSPSRLPAPKHDWNPGNGGGSSKRGQGSRQRKKNGLKARSRGKGKEDLFGPLEGGDGYEEPRYGGEGHSDFGAGVNGHSNRGTPLKGRKKEEYVPQNGGDLSTDKVSREDVKQVLVNGFVKAANQPGPLPELSKNDFVREILTLIHTDSSFADEIYNAYMKKTRRVRT